ncbi:MAG TPA: 50S ribosomal protein L18 [Syntrophaceticus sp.]|jgi:large subunit ribosomal protein L18|uniref:Large ribosomal subunit protein uL18 n=1 Tax=Syntrophaceticus schinkii TaxID=499207 RepID=A0A0B7MHQ3_9FIRM|nr:50S ribosomal protein L18 [Syntrophaceticus schinkii]HHY29963.1 50S ribosomal protein L18 [Syntrophaceticus sp.]MDD2360384.1 50S ribosomal protein L18 [Syntrophaceticus schinkii]MDD4261517.1 50S ribosomal protein L18 [Syntrophaceticus schinkii]MDD4675106.1 50S ribosomal protein L18 [Syntrophaceticus schinkii]CEO90164.1 ribosomal protein L18 [Syntrophaceticus schinkii]
MARETRATKRNRKHSRVRRKVFGTAERPRLCIYKSLNHIYAQVIDDSKGETLASASTLSPEIREDVGGKKDMAAARIVGQLVAEKANAKGIKRVVFDRGGFPYHGRVAAFADAARENGLEF